MEIVRAAAQDAEILAGLACLLWDSHSRKELENRFSDLLEGENAACFLAYAAGCPVGFAQCQLRHDYVEGTKNSPVGYLEGIFVRPEYRGRGLARRLLKACEDWTKERGCREFASDCELENDASLQFHLRMGFAEANRIICFVKSV